MEEGSGLKIDFSTQTYRGKNYSTEFCEGFELPQGFCIVVCSGENGINNEGGALAAKLALEGIKKHFHNNPIRNIQSSLQKAMILANFMVYDHAMKNQRFQGMGVNIAVIIIWNDLIYYAVTGKVSILLERQTTLYQLYKPEIQTSELNSPLLGTEKNAGFHISKNPIQAIAGDAIFCSNQNLAQEFSDEQIAELLAQEDMSTDLICYQIVYKLNEIQSPENVVIAISRLVDITELPPQPEPAQEKQTEIPQTNYSKKRINILVTIVLAIFAIIVIIFATMPGDTEEDPLVKPKSKTEQTKNGTTEINAPIAPAGKNDNKPENTKPSNKPLITIEHKVEKGETLYRISRQYNIPIAELEKFNQIKAGNLKFGQKIKIPVIAVHTVNDGETLLSIAEKYKVTVSDIEQANKLKNNQMLRAGKKLIIPRSSK